MLGIIGGTGFESVPKFEITRKQAVDTPYGKPSSALYYATLNGNPSIVLSRHGTGPRIMPHQINYRANIYALHDQGVTDVIAIAAVGGITRRFISGSLSLPDQIIDYTWGREHTFFDNTVNFNIPTKDLGHVEFAYPYDLHLRESILKCAKNAGQPIIDHGVYGVTQGPRFETAAEIDRMDRDGADMVGMTAMPEAALARELGMSYATLAMVVNPAAGRSNEAISMAGIRQILEKTTNKVYQMLLAFHSIR
ncbi:MAG: S-methyl-5'-thioinosine phosphorylase [Gammaproteobacteria bacterium]|nr:S-methyl-5'-thioinosine phosphorylase [Gammaproteobacteria bacterium]MCY4217808.1 S-methyl-5'-thioinosine phosphorylase [Gammaproteobacteria bacterium]MCY4274916.1 S-methyl-5'-thioinosine phosphorylase [Gammaproteobacteria bacterium]